MKETTARIEIKTPKVSLKLDHVLYLRSLAGDKVSCSICSEDRSRLQLLGLVKSVDIEPTEEQKRKHAEKMKELRAEVDKAYKEQNWERLGNAVYNIKHQPTAPLKASKLVLTEDGKALLRDGGVTIAIKNGCGK